MGVEQVEGLNSYSNLNAWTGWWRSRDCQVQTGEPGGLESLSLDLGLGQWWRCCKARGGVRDR